MVQIAPMSQVIRPITAADNAAVASIIRRVMPEFGADGPGFAIHDAEVDDMCAAYAILRAAYFVVEKDGVVMGGGGFVARGFCEHGQNGGASTLAPGAERLPLLSTARTR